MAVFSWFKKSNAEKQNQIDQTNVELKLQTSQTSTLDNNLTNEFTTNSTYSTSIIENEVNNISTITTDNDLEDEFLDLDEAPTFRSYTFPKTENSATLQLKKEIIQETANSTSLAQPISTNVETAKDSIESSTDSSTEFDESKPKMRFFKRLVKGLSKTSNIMGANLATIFKGKKIDASLYEELEESLLSADVGWETTDKIITKLQQHSKAIELKDSEALYARLKLELNDIINPYAVPLDITTKKPFLILMVGVNGVGKTTTIGKITKKLQANGLSVILAAGDTFRAAAVEQLQEWGQRNNVPVIAQKTGSDSASVIYDAFNSAIAKNIDVVIADTAGRLQNKGHLLEELRKIVRVIKKLDPTAPHEVMITLDATTGQNAINQVEEFNKAVNITGITITKLDGTGKGGVIFAICDKLKKPIRFIGVGEKIDDLQPFDSKQFINALFDNQEK